MARQADPRALLEKTTPENVAKMREIAEILAKFDERNNVSKETTTKENAKLSEPKQKR